MRHPDRKAGTSGAEQEGTGDVRELTIRLWVFSCRALCKFHIGQFLFICSCGLTVLL